MQPFYYDPSRAYQQPPTAMPYSMGYENFAPQPDPSLHHGQTPFYKATLARALRMANTAVLLDSNENFEAAYRAYNEVCNFIGRILARSEMSPARDKLTDIYHSYMARITVLERIVYMRGYMPPNTQPPQTMPNYGASAMSTYPMMPMYSDASMRNDSRTPMFGMSSFNNASQARLMPQYPPMDPLAAPPMLYQDMPSPMMSNHAQHNIPSPLMGPPTSSMASSASLLNSSVPPSVPSSVPLSVQPSPSDPPPVKPSDQSLVKPSDQLAGQHSSEQPSVQPSVETSQRQTPLSASPSSASSMQSSITLPLQDLDDDVETPHAQDVNSSAASSESISPVLNLTKSLSGDSAQQSQQNEAHQTETNTLGRQSQHKRSSDTRASVNSMVEEGEDEEEQILESMLAGLELNVPTNTSLGENTSSEPGNALTPGTSTPSNGRPFFSKITKSASNLKGAIRSPFLGSLPPPPSKPAPIPNLTTAPRSLGLEPLPPPPSSLPPVPSVEPPSQSKDSGLRSRRFQGHAKQLRIYPPSRFLPSTLSGNRKDAQNGKSRSQEEDKREATSNGPAEPMSTSGSLRGKRMSIMSTTSQKSLMRRGVEWIRHS